jgi:hypothetical protein
MGEIGSQSKTVTIFTIIYLPTSNIKPASTPMPIIQTVFPATGA